MLTLLIPLIGGSGIGLVWGWHTGLAFSSRNNMVFKAASAFVGIASMATLIYLISGLITTCAFAVGGACAFLAHNAWVYRLQQNLGGRKK